jgi:hypothetical protein
VVQQLPLEADAVGARPLRRFGPDGGVRVRSAQPLGKTQGVRLLREAERLTRRPRQLDITNDAGVVSGTSLTLLTSLVAARSSDHAARFITRLAPIASIVHGRPLAAVPLAGVGRLA